MTSKEICKRLLGRRIVKVYPRSFRTGNSRSDYSYKPIIELDDGTQVRFVVAETQIGTYGIDLVFEELR